jgi:3-dehydrosphinganine reductase
MYDYENKLALVTGGSSGIGLSLAKALAARGTHVFILARRLEQLEVALKEIEGLRLNAQQKFGVISADVSNPGQIKEKLVDFIQRYGCPDILINAAGVVHPGEFIELDDELTAWMINVNYLGTAYVTRQVAPGMVTRKSGLIINFSSVAGYVALFYGYTAYCGSKYAVRGFTDALRLEMKPRGVQVAIVFPADVDTPQHDYEIQHQTGLVKAFHQVLVNLFNGKVISPDQVANEVLKDAAKGRYIINPGPDAKFGYFAAGFLGNLVYPLLDMILRTAQRNLTKQLSQKSNQSSE